MRPSLVPAKRSCCNSVQRSCPALLNFTLPLFVLLAGCSRDGRSGPSTENDRISESPAAVTIFAAAGTRDATEALCDAFEEETGIRVERSYASSGTLARQIAQGAPADVFVSANRRWIDFLLQKKLLNPDSVRTIAANRLAVVVPRDTPENIVTAASFTREFDIGALPGRIAMGDPSYVPVGKYTNEVLDRLGWRTKLSSKLVFAKDVSAVLRYVELGECRYGFVYRSEALRSDKVKIVAEVPESLHAPIRFFAATLAERSETAERLKRRFSTDAGKAAFTDRGFSPMPVLAER